MVHATVHAQEPKHPATVPLEDATVPLEDATVLLDDPTAPNVEAAIDLLRQAIALLTAGDAPPAPSINVGDAVTVSEAIGVRLRRGREIPYSESELAFVYNRHVEQGGKAPREAVAAAFGASKYWANPKIRKARDKGMLLDPPRRPKRSDGGR